jgi:antitoxin component HigA of HigAB toxin-antitoxin module
MVYAEDHLRSREGIKGGALQCAYDLADIFGSQANVSKFLNSERPLSMKQISGLKERFGISADFFVK